MLGSVNDNISFAKGMADKAQPLYKLTGNNPFKLGQVEQQGFQVVDAVLLSPPVLALPNTTDPFNFVLVVSQLAVRVELIQVQDGEENVML